MRTGALPAAVPNVAPASLWPLTALPHLPAVLRSLAPDRGIDNIPPFYFPVMGTCLSFVLVFKSNIAYNRHATATAHTRTLNLQTHGPNARPRFAEPHIAHTPPAALQSAERPPLAR